METGGAVTYGGGFGGADGVGVVAIEEGGAGVGGAEGPPEMGGSAATRALDSANGKASIRRNSLPEISCVSVLAGGGGDAGRGTG